jgi:O-acetyl-ADP-ribose deacetylase (regulator of RNase III)
MEIPQLELGEYRNAIHLDDPYQRESNPNLTAKEKEYIIANLLEWLLGENSAPSKSLASRIKDKRRLLRALLNVRAPKPLNPNILKQLDRLLQAEAVEAGITKASALMPVSAALAEVQWEHKEKFVLWQGDITLLEIDAIVNAANAGMLGCLEPLHACIDNAIHSAAGPQLRDDCNIIISIQKQREKTGDAKITRAYNLPCKFVLHTVGPIIPGGTMVKQHQKEELALSYISCLELANKVEAINSIAFCAISTGVFGFPKREAAQIAVSTVNSWLTNNPNRFKQILFCVFSEDDSREYAGAFQRE